MWTTMLCHPSAFFKLSVTMASFPHRNCPSDRQVYIAMGSWMLSGAVLGWDEGGKQSGNMQKKCHCGGDWRWEMWGEWAKGGMKEVIYRWWVWFALALLSHGKIYFSGGLEDEGEQGGEDSAPALPQPQAPRGLAQVQRAILITLHSGASRHGTAKSLRDNPMPRFSSILRSILSLFPCPLLTFLSSPGHPFPAGRAKNTKHWPPLCHQSHLTPSRTTWLIANPILVPLGVGEGFSVLLSHFIRDH